MKHSRTGILFARACVFAWLAAAAPAPAKDRVAEIDQPIPALKDGRRVALADVEQAILTACRKRNFTCTVVSPGLIAGRYTHNRNYLADVTIPFSDQSFQIKYQDSVGMGYNAARSKIKDDYNAWVEALAEHIEAHVDQALKRLRKTGA